MRLPWADREAALAIEQASVLARLGAAGTFDILDVGCANGRAYSRDLRAFARHYVGFELSYPALVGARDRLGTECQLVNGNAESLPFAADSFDVVFLNDMLAYCDKPQVLREASRVLRPGGVIVSLHNNSLGWSLYKMRHPEKPLLVEWSHSLVVIANSLLHRATGLRLFHTTFNTRADLVCAALDSGLAIDAVWWTRKVYRWWHFIARKPAHAPPPARPVALLTGSYLSQNMGAAAMTLVANEQLGRIGYDPVLLAKYPADDRAFASRYGVRLQPANQFVYTFGVIPLLLLLMPLPVLRRWIRATWFHDAALCYDLGGITFASSRGLSGFVINLTWLLLALFLGIPLVKGSQAMGPFDRWYLRATLPLLRRVRMIHARGAETLAHLRRARVRARLTPDIAFLLAPEQTMTPAAGFVVLVPSTVVRRRYDGTAGEGAYLALFVALARHLLANGKRVLVLAHSYRDGDTENSNDWPLCRQIAALVDNPDLMLHASQGCSPGELKFVLGLAEVVVASRFHAMVASLSMGVPVLVTSWSHKYREVLAMFDMQDWTVDWRTMDVEGMQARTDRLLNEAPSLRVRIASHLDNVKAGAEGNFEDLPWPPGR